MTRGERGRGPAGARSWIACALAAAVALGAAAPGCGSSGGASLVVVVTASGSPADVTALEVTISGPAGFDRVPYPAGSQAPIVFPTTLGAELPARALGSLSLQVDAIDSRGIMVATGHIDSFTLRAGQRRTVYVGLTCSAGPCGAVDAGPIEPDGGASPPSPRCGNGKVDPGETCDVAIAPGDPGACPPANCDDHIDCTTDIRTGDACTAVCTHQEKTLDMTKLGDGCCPAGATHATKADCPATCGNGTVDPGETCDTAIRAGAPGACPTDADCITGSTCSHDALISRGTCDAICIHDPITVQSATPDGCCPPGAYHGVDVDCPIAVCGNGIVEPGETCDVAIASPAAGACPQGCDDQNVETTDFLSGAGCQSTCVHLTITAPISGDGFCPAGATHATDSDCPARCTADSPCPGVCEGPDGGVANCPATCGNGVVDPGETCDSNATGAAACPFVCPPPTSTCLTVTLAGSTAECSARCVTSTITTCSLRSDGCCPAGCTAATDADCSATCGNGSVEPASGETCDTAIAAGRPGACPTSCTSPDACTEARLVSAGTCTAVCVFVPITGFRAGDGCCPPGANFNVDPDCRPACGDGVVEPPVEACDSAVSGSCPAQAADCPTAGSCARVALTGSAAACSARCVTSPIDVCGPADGCCPGGCTAVADPDCPPVCGDGVIEAGESCDRAITAGITGSCPHTCDDGNQCTVDLAAGSVEACSRICTHMAITACLGGDGCCPLGCTSATDSDCGAKCGDNKVGAGETCDPPSSCPTVCPDDGDPCTREVLTGDPARCTAACRHLPIISCSGTTSDLCCPSGCTAATDTDC